MPLTPNFSTSQVLGSPNQFTITDASTGSDVAIVSRRVFILTATGDYLVPEGNVSPVYVVWPLAEANITLSVLEKDMALSVRVDWVDVNGNAVVTKTAIYGFTQYNELFYYDLTERQVSRPLIIEDTSYYDNKMRLRVEVDAGDQAVIFGADIYSAQSCYDRATYLRINQDKYF